MKTLNQRLILLLITASTLCGQTELRPRARDLGIEVGVLPTGPLNAITDVAGVKVGQTTIIRGDNIRTGITAIVPQAGNLYRERVLAAVFLGNAYGKLAGSTQVNEMGEIETPILLTGTDSVFRAADALVTYMFNLKDGWERSFKTFVFRASVGDSRGVYCEFERLKRCHSFPELRAIPELPSILKIRGSVSQPFLFKCRRISEQRLARVELLVAYWESKGIQSY
jgi:hypothetical protein